MALSRMNKALDVSGTKTQSLKDEEKKRQEEEERKRREAEALKKQAAVKNTAASAAETAAETRQATGRSPLKTQEELKEMFARDYVRGKDMATGKMVVERRKPVYTGSGRPEGDPLQDGIENWRRWATDTAAYFDQVRKSGSMDSDRTVRSGNMSALSDRYLDMSLNAYGSRKQRMDKAREVYDNDQALVSALYAIEQGSDREGLHEPEKEALDKMMAEGGYSSYDELLKDYHSAMDNDAYGVVDSIYKELEAEKKNRDRVNKWQGVQSEGAASSLWNSEYAAKSYDEWESSLPWWEKLLMSEQTQGERTYHYINNADFAKQLKGNGYEDGSLYEEAQGYDYLTEAEKSIYNYLYNNGRYGDAKAYLNDLSRTLNARKASALANYQEELAYQHPILGGAAELVSGVSQAYMYPFQALNALGGDVDLNSWLYDMNRSTGKLHEGKIRNAAEKFPQAFPDNGITRAFGLAGQNISSFVIGAVDSAVQDYLRKALGGGNETAALLLGAAREGSDTLYEMIERGWDPASALFVSLAAAGTEYGVEKMNVDDLFGDPDLNNPVGWVLKQVASEDLEEIIGYAVGMGVDELTAAITDNVSKTRAAATQYMREGLNAEDAWKRAKDENWQELMNTIASTTVSTGMTTVGRTALTMGQQSAAEREERKAQGKEIMDKGTQKSLLDIADTLPKDTKAYKTAQKLKDGKLNASRTGMLYMSVMDALDEEAGQTVSAVVAGDVQQRLMEDAQELKDDKERAKEQSLAKDAASAIAKTLGGQKLTLKERMALLQSKYGMSILAQLSEPMTDEEMREAGIAAASEDADKPQAPADAAADTQTWRKSVRRKIAVEEARAAGRMQDVMRLRLEATDKAVEASRDVAAEKTVGKGDGEKNAVKVGGEDATLLRVERTRDGSAELVVEKGGKQETIDLEDASFGNRGTAQVVAWAAEAGVSREEANLIWQNAPQGKGADVESYIRAMSGAYEAGVDNRSFELALKAQGASREMMQIAFDAGTRERGARQAARVKAQEELRNSGDGANARVTVALEDGTEEEWDKGNEKVAAFMDSLTEDQKEQVELLSEISKVSGVGFRFFKSQVDSAGNFVGENGSYDQKTGVISVDVNAGRKSATDSMRTVMAATASHELTHFMEQYGGSAYNRLEDFVLGELERKGQDVKRLAQQKRDNAKASGMEMTRAEAMDEVIADACEQMLMDSTAYERMATQDKGLLDAVREFVRGFAEQMKKAFAGFTGKEESRALMAAEEARKQLQSIWDEGFVEAVEARRGENGTQDTNAQTVEEHADDGKVKHQVRGNAYDFSKPFADQVEDWKNGWFPAGDTLVIGRTPDIYTRVGISRLPMVFDQQHIADVLSNPPKADHDITEAVLKDLPELLKKPVAIIESKTRPGDSVVAIVNKVVGGKPVIAAVEINGKGKVNGATIDATDVTTAHRRKNAISVLLYDALQKEQSKQGVGVYYINKKEAVTLASVLGLQLPIGTVRDGFNHSILENDSPVNRKILDQTKTRQFKAWFGNSKVVDANGNPKVLYHQTGEDFTEFDTRHDGAGATDDVTPYGIFMKEGTQDIGVKGKKQMPLYASIQFPLVLANRDDAEQYFARNISDYRKNREAIAEMKTRYEAALAKAEDETDAWYKEHYDEIRRGEIGQDEVDRAESEADRIMAEWEEEEGKLRKKGKELVQQYMERSRYDGMILNEDEGSYGRKVKTYIALKPEQVKSANDNVGLFDKKNTDIRYSKRDSEGNELSEQVQQYFEKSKVRNKKGELLVMYHGTPNGSYEQFRSGTYFTENREYAEGYKNPNASAISVKRNADAPTTFAAYLNMEKPFDTRKAKERRIFEREYYRQWGTGTPLMESGLPDWTDGIDLQEFLEEKGYDYDGLILDEGAVYNLDGSLKPRGLSYVIFDPKQAKTIDNKTPTSDPRYRYSLRDIPHDAETIENNYSAVRRMKPVTVLNGNEFMMGTDGLYKSVLDYFNEIGGMAHRDDAGDVILNQRSIKDSRGHGMTPLKALMYKALPSVIEKGKLLDYESNWKNRGYETAVVAAPVNVKRGSMAGEYYVVAVLRGTENNGQRYYTHEAAGIVKKETAQTLVESNSKSDPGTKPGGLELETIAMSKSLLDSILNKLNGVNREISVSEAVEAPKKQFSLREFTYDELVDKPDMKLTALKDNVGRRDRGEMVRRGYENAMKLGVTQNGMPAVMVEDIGRRVHVSKAALRHSIDRRADALSGPVQHVGELLQNAILVNEAEAKKQTAAGSYILLSAGRNDAGSLQAVVFTVNKFNVVEDMDVLYSMRQKTESAAPKARASAASALSLTDSTISIAQLLDTFKSEISDILSQDAVDALGVTREDTEITKYLKYSQRDSEGNEQADQNEKQTKKWFQVQGNKRPFDGTKSGFVRSIQYEDEKVNNGNVKFSIRETAGTKYVWVDQQPLTNAELRDPKNIAAYLALHVGEMYQNEASGRMVYLGKKLPNEYTRSRYTQNLVSRIQNRTIRERLEAKHRVVGNLGEMIEIADNRRMEAAIHTHNKDAKYGFFRFDTRFAFPIEDSNGKVIGAKCYTAEMIAYNSSDMKSYLYDVVNIKEDSQSTQRISKKILGKIGHQKMTPQPNAVSTNQYTQNGGNVNNQNLYDVVKIKEDVSTAFRISNSILRQAAHQKNVQPTPSKNVSTIQYTQNGENVNNQNLYDVVKIKEDSQSTLRISNETLRKIGHQKMTPQPNAVSTNQYTQNGENVNNQNAETTKYSQREYVVTDREVMASIDPEDVKDVKDRNRLALYQNALNELTALRSVAAEMDGEGMTEEARRELTAKLSAAENRVQRLEELPELQAIVKEQRGFYDTAIAGKTSADTARQVEAMKETISELRRRVAHGQTRDYDISRLRTLARNMKRTFGGSMNVTDLTERLADVYERYAKAGMTAEVEDTLEWIADSMLDTITEVDRSGLEKYGDAAGLIKGPISLSEGLWRELKREYGSIEDARRAYKGLDLQSSTSGERGNIDVVWQQLNGMLPNLFQNDVLAERDMLEELAQAAQSLKAVKRGLDPETRQGMKESAMQMMAMTIGRVRTLMGDQRQIRRLEAQVERLESQSAQKLLKMEENYYAMKDSMRKRRELMDQRGKVNRRIQRAVKRLDKLRRNETDWEHVPEGMKNAVNAMMQELLTDGQMKFGLDKKRLNAMRAFYEHVDRSDNGFENLKYKEDESVLEWLRTMPELLEKEGRLRTAGGLQSNYVGNMEEQLPILEDMANILEHFRDLVEHGNEAFMNGKKVQFDKMGMEALRELRDMKGKSVWKHGQQGRETLERFIKEGNTTPIYFFQEENVGKQMAQVFDGIRYAQNQWAHRAQESRDAMQEIMRQYNYWDWQSNEKRIHVKTHGGADVHLTTGEALSLYATWRRQNQNALQQAEHLNRGGFVFAGAIERDQDGNARYKARPTLMSNEDISAVAAQLTDEQLKMADAVVEFMSTTLADWGNEASMERYGYKKFNEKYYFPYQSSRDFLLQESDKGASGVNTDRLASLGMTKKLVSHANNPVVIEDFMETAARHVEQMVTYSTMMNPIENMNRLLNYKMELTEEGKTIEEAVREEEGESLTQQEKFSLRDNVGRPVDEQLRDRKRHKDRAIAVRNTALKSVGIDTDHIFMPQGVINKGTRQKNGTSRSAHGLDMSVFYNMERDMNSAETVIHRKETGDYVLLKNTQDGKAMVYALHHDVIEGQREWVVRSVYEKENAAAYAATLRSKGEDIDVYVRNEKSAQDNSFPYTMTGSANQQGADANERRNPYPMTGSDLHRGGSATDGRSPYLMTGADLSNGADARLSGIPYIMTGANSTLSADIRGAQGLRDSFALLAGTTTVSDDKIAQEEGNVKKKFSVREGENGGEEYLPRVTVRAMMREKLGNSGLDYVETFLQDMNGGVRQDPSEKYLDRLVAGFKKNAVFASLSVAVQQPTAIARAAMEISPKYLFKTLPGSAWNVLKRSGGLTQSGYQEAWEECKRYAGTAVIKDMGRFDMGMGGATADWMIQHDMSDEKFLYRAKELFNLKDSSYRDEVLGWLPGFMDRITWTHLWNAVKAEQAAQNPGMDQTSDEFLEKCGQRFDYIVDKTQVYDSTLVRSQNMRAKSSAMKTVTAFMAEPTLTLNMLMDGFGRGIKNHDAGLITKTLTVYVANALLGAMAKALVSGKRPDDEKDQPWLDSYIRAVSGGAVEALNPLGMIPWVQDVYSKVSGWDVERADMSMVSALWDAWTSLQSDTKSDWRKVEDMAGAIGAFVGLPVKNVLRDIRTVMNHFGDTAQANLPAATRVWWDILEGIDDPLMGKPRGTKNSDYAQRLYSAAASGDETAWALEYEAATVRGGMDEEQIQKGIKKVVKEQLLTGKLDEEKAIRLLVDYAGVTKKSGRSAEDIAWEQVEKWREEAAHEDEEGYTYSLYAGLREALQTGQGIEEERKRLMAHGYDADDMKSKSKSLIGELYRGGEISEEAAKRRLADWCGMKDADDLFWQIDEWNEKEKNKEVDEYSYSRFAGVYDAVKGMKALPAEDMRKLTGNGYSEKELQGKIQTEIGKWYVAGEMTRAEAEKRIRKYSLRDQTDNDLHWVFKEWDYKKKNGTTEGYSKYMDFYSAVESGNGLKECIGELVKYSNETEKEAKGTISSAITSHYKPLLVELVKKGKKTEAAALQARILTAYQALGYDRTKKLRDVQKWYEGI